MSSKTKDNEFTLLIAYLCIMKLTKTVLEKPLAVKKIDKPQYANRKISVRADKWFISDIQFHHLYPDSLLPQASMHWTPLQIAKKAAEFLSVGRAPKILDIGSGAGKFCLSAAYYQPKTFFYGIEQRSDLVKSAESAREVLQLQNVYFLHANITSLDLSPYDHFYFFNSFYENLDDNFKIDNQILYSAELYGIYKNYLYKQFEKKPIGTRIATFHSTEDEIPEQFHEVGSSEDNLLKFWVKV